MSGSLGFAATLLGAVTMGLTCGAGCSPAIAMFLGNYVVQAEGEQKKTLTVFGLFYGGKAAAVLLVCTVAALVGSAVVNADGYLGRYDLDSIMPIFLLVSGLYLLYQCLIEHKKYGCKECKKCGKRSSYLKYSSPFLGGFIYGLTPCAPLVLLAGYAVTLPFWQAFLLGVVFSVACSVPSLFMILVFAKLLVVKIKQEVPSLLQALKYMMSAAVAGVGAYLLMSGGSIR